MESYSNQQYSQFYQGRRSSYEPYYSAQYSPRYNNTQEEYQPSWKRQDEPNEPQEEHRTFQNKSSTLQELKVKQWIEEMLEQELDCESNGFAGLLRDSKILCRLLNKIQPGTIHTNSYDEDPLPQYKMLENIKCFVKKCREMGVPEESLFMTIDLFEENNMKLVVECLLQLKVIVQSQQQQQQRQTSHETKEIELPKTKKVLKYRGNRRFIWGLLNGIASCIIGPMIFGVAIGFGVNLGNIVHSKVLVFAKS